MKITSIKIDATKKSAWKNPEEPATTKIVTVGIYDYAYGHAIRWDQSVPDHHRARLLHADRRVFRPLIWDNPDRPQRRRNLKR